MTFDPAATPARGNYGGCVIDRARQHRKCADAVDTAVALACRAPSLHNTQPWRWTVGAGSVRLSADSDRVLHATDRSGRQMILSCGIALGHFRTAMAGQGWATEVDYLPNPHRPDRLAVVTFRPEECSAEARARAAAIELRRTNRSPLDPPPQWDTLLARLRDECKGFGAVLSDVSSAGRERIAAASDLANKRRRFDVAYSDELRWWVGNPAHEHEGVPAAALPASVERRRVDIARRFSPQDRTARADSTDRSALLVLAVASDSRFDVVRAGEAASTVLLAATSAGLESAVLTHVTEHDAIREVVRDAVGVHELPQVLLRIGLARTGSVPIPATPRRPVGEVVERRR